MKPWQNVLIGFLLGLIVSGGILLIIHSPGGQALVLEPSPTSAPIMVHVVGAIQNPGVYSLAEGSKVIDLVTAAGGFTTDALPDSINQAQTLRDGDKVRIIRKDEVDTELPDENDNNFSDEQEIIVININTASVEELDALPGIGPAKAQEIVAYREAHGDFLVVEEIMNVPGIGETLFEQIQNIISVK